MQTYSGPLRVKFGRFELDQTEGELYRDGRRIHLQEHPRQVLVALLERPGELVTRDDLRDRLWKSDTFVDFEHGLNTAVKKARQALGDSADSPRYIETVARRGYRFIGRIEPAELSPRPPAPIQEPESLSAALPSVLGRPSRRFLAAAIAVVLLAATLAVWLVPRRTAENSVAVMPLSVVTESDSESMYLGVGVADAITTRLANTRQVAVRPTAAVLPFKDAQSNPARIASLLGVRHLLLGSIRRTEHTYRITLQLVDRDGVAVWGRTFDEPHAAFPQLQDHIAEQVVAALRVELSPPERARLHVRYTTNPAAYDLYLRGRSLLLNYTEDNMRLAIGHFEEALRLDENYALARAGIATATAWFSVRYAHQEEAIAWAKRADEEARRALEQDASLADAHLAIANAAGTTYGGFDWKKVLERTATALALDPSLDLAHAARMRAFYHLGLLSEAIEEGRRARALNPNPSVEVDRLQIVVQMLEGQYVSAVKQAEDLLPRTDASAIPQYLGLAKFYTGDAAGARTILESIVRNGRPDERAESSLASIEAAVGMRDQARARIAAVLRAPDQDHHVAYSLGAAFAQLGDADASVMWLERAANTGFPCYPWFQRDSLLDPVRRDSRFVQLIERMRSAYQQARQRWNTNS